MESSILEDFYKIFFITISKLMRGGIILIISLIAPPSRHFRGESHNFLIPRYLVKVHTALTELINISLEMLQVVQLN